MKRTAGTALLALVFGFGLERMGFADFGEVHRMFTFESLRLFLAFAGGVTLAAIVFAILRKRLPSTPSNPHRGAVIGGALFGVGWAITGACPSIAGVQLATGKVPALATLVGITLGTWLFEWINSRYLHWESRSCSE